MSLEGFINTIPDLLRHRVELAPSSTAILEKSHSQIWTGLTWRQFDQAVEHLTQQLMSAGIGRGDQVAILMPNAVQWEIVQHAVFRLGGVIIGLDLNDPAQRVDDIFNQCSIRALIIDGADRLDQIPQHHIEAIDLILCRHWERNSCKGPNIKILADIQAPPMPIETPSPDGSTVATIIFTSGTTGRPKALWYTHGQLVSAVRSITDLFADLPDQAHTACWLPLANPFQRIINLCAIAANWRCYIVPDPTQIMSAVKEIEPHFFAGVPRFYEKLFQAIEDGIRKRPPWQKALPMWAVRVGKSVSAKRETKRSISWHLKWLHRIADILVLCRIRRIMGRHLKYFISGSAPLSDELIRKCLAFGWPIYEAYGISENIAPMAMNSPGAWRLGSVGRPLGANIIRIADDGEILVKSPCVAINLKPDGNGGFLTTGDLGRIASDGYLYLQGRKNDTFKLSTGRKIIPQPIEEALSLLDGVEHCVAVGHKRKQVIALLNVPADSWRRLSDLNGGEMGARSVLKNEARMVCAHLPRYCRPAEVLIINDPFSPATGELTTNYKLRRHAVISKYTSAIDRCYQQIEAERN